MPGLNTDALVDGLVSNALQLGLFNKVNTHEPKAAPGTGISAAVWFETVQPFPEGSGLNSTSVIVTMTFRVYQNFISEPQDLIDPNLMKAVDVLLGQYSQDFTLNGEVRQVDLLGEGGTPLSAQSGYVNLDGRMYRSVDVVLPIIVNDAWSQNA